VKAGRQCIKPHAITGLSHKGAVDLIGISNSIRSAHFLLRFAIDNQTSYKMKSTALRLVDLLGNQKSAPSVLGNRLGFIRMAWPASRHGVHTVRDVHAHFRPTISKLSPYCLAASPITRKPPHANGFSHAPARSKIRENLRGVKLVGQTVYRRGTPAYSAMFFDNTLTSREYSIAVIDAPQYRACP